MAPTQLRIQALRCGVLSAQADAFVEGMAGDVDLQVWAFLIQHPKGTVLFDTGMHPAIRESARDHIGGVADLFRITYGGDDDIRAQLTKAGVDPASIDRVVCSHLHFDHAGGNSLLPDARVVVQQREWEHARHEEGGGYAHGDWDTGQDLELVDGEHDLFGDLRVVCVPTYGHTPGHQSLLVRLGGGELLLTADACYLRASLEALAVPAFGWDLDRQREVMRDFARLEAAGTALVFGHDPVLSPAVEALLD
jgi:glyoxylase-like metal-dependent hydrolase (beta-lactamase superfamily II)